MRSLYVYKTPVHDCTYLPDRRASLEYEVAELTPAEYLRRMLEGWRRFGHTLFHPVCSACQACVALRVPVADFRPNRSQRRCWRGSEGVYELRIGKPSVTRAKLALYDRYHAHQAVHKDWPDKGEQDRNSYEEAFVVQPFAVEEWCYYRAGRLVGVGYVDSLEDSLPGDGGREGLSLIYFYYDPDERKQGLGTLNVLTALAEAARRGLPYVYLGYFVEGCGSLEYKARFCPNEIRGADGMWRPFRL